MKATFLGTGTSVGVPMIGCDCAVCRSKDAKNRRRRSSLYVVAGGVHILVDTPPDFREQALEYHIPRVDAILFTHSHADHIFGFDDIRRFNTIQDAIIPAYGSAATIADLKRIFDYVHLEAVVGMYRPRTEFRVLGGDALRLGEVTVVPLTVRHGDKPANGYLFRCAGRSLAYVPDCSGMDEAVVDMLHGIDVMILDALRHRPHATHLTLKDSVELLGRIGAGRSYITHMAHDLEHQATQRDTPDWLEVSFDGLVVEW